MKTSSPMFALSLLLIAASAQGAYGLRFKDEAVKVKNKIQNDVMRINGAAGIGVTACNDRTGELDPDERRLPAVAGEISAQRLHSERLCGLCLSRRRQGGVRAPAPPARHQILRLGVDEEVHAEILRQQVRTAGSGSPCAKGCARPTRLG